MQSTGISPKGQQTTTAMIIMIGAMLLVPGMDILAKWLAATFGLAPASITFMRFLVQTILMFLLIVIRFRTLKIIAKNPLFNIIRGLLSGAASMFIFISVKYMPVADAISIFFVEPIFVMFLSWIFLGETIGWRRVIAAITGFGGALLVIQPSFAQFGAISLLPLCAAISFSFYLILTGKFGNEDNPMFMQFYSGFGGMVFCFIALMFGQATAITDLAITIPSHFEAIGWLFVIGVIATVAHLMIVTAFSMAPASVLAPFQYIEIVSATILGLLIFDNFPSPSKWFGTAIIIASGLYIFWREQYSAKYQ